MEREAGRTRKQRVVDFAQPIQRNARRDLRRGARRAVSTEAATTSCSGFSDANKLASSSSKYFLTSASGSSAGIVPFSTSVRAQLLTHGRMRRDRLVHHRLRERRLVALVVSVAPVADEVDQEVEAEARAVLPRQPRRLEARDRIVRVDVHDRES